MDSFRAERSRRIGSTITTKGGWSRIMDECEIGHPCFTGFLRWLVDMPGQATIKYNAGDIIRCVEDASDWQEEFSCYMEQRHLEEPQYARLRQIRAVDESRWD
mgnify:CR=1 FL=1